MKVSEVYKIYLTPNSLQEHMLRVASLAKILLADWTGILVDKASIVRACTLHDIAKPMNFDLTKQAAFGMSDSDIEKLGEFQIKLKTEYGSNEHHATVGICKTIGCDQNTIKFVNNLEWNYLPRLFQEDDISSLISIYCDMRIGPEGILPLPTRLREIKERVGGDDYENNVRNGSVLEEKIIENVALDVQTITTDQLDSNFNLLLNLEVS